MAYVPAARAEVGSRIEIDVRGSRRHALIERKPLYRRES
jgi:glycine cleavage system aminomethyltransferase T